MCLCFVSSSQVYDRFSLEDFEALIKETLKTNGYEYIMPRIINENRVVNFYFIFSTSNDDRFYEGMGVCMAMVAEITEKVSWVSKTAYFSIKQPAEIFAWIDTRDCRVSRKIQDEKKRAEYIDLKLHYIKKQIKIRDKVG
jgi:hypothetical protein